ncbi:MAG: ArsC/Spx/MgsR family protein [Cyanobacteria bacterium P01_C01_bin.70]
MTIVVFFEKPGCIGNARQKYLLQAAGHRLQVQNLLTELWTPEKLRLFFGDRPVSEWFNPTAPPITHGEIHPENLDADAALQLMIQQPILIRRPLIQVGDRYAAGFDLAEINAWIGLAPSPDLTRDVETCPKTIAV